MDRPKNRGPFVMVRLDPTLERALGTSRSLYAYITITNYSKLAWSKPAKRWR